MREVDLASSLKRSIEDRREQLVETLTSGALTCMEQYKYIHGELKALSFIEDEIAEHFKER
jgi:hypothetical protein|tara:strand:+ start:1279 stop:1461 length:183 start_codon:yes stop_codon:yes gene_type:complete